MRAYLSGLVLLSSLGLGVYWYSLFPFRPEHQLLHISFDATPSVFQAIDQHFNSETGEAFGMSICTTHAGSIQQSNNLAQGLTADLISLSSSSEVESVRRATRAISPDWAQKFPHNSSPFYSTVVWVFRTGHQSAPTPVSWVDLEHPDLRICLPDPGTSGAGRYAYLALYECLKRELEASHELANKRFFKIISRADFIPGGSRRATATFLHQSEYNVLITWESEALSIPPSEFPIFQVIYPAVSMLAEPVVSVMDVYTERRHTQHMAERYLQYLFDDHSQRHFAESGFRPRSERVMRDFRGKFPPIRLLNVETHLGGWALVETIHFSPKGSLQSVRQLQEARMGGSE